MLKDEGWRPLAWNGVSFNVPGSWEAASMGLDYLLLEDEDRPVVEIKWNRVKGRFAPQAKLEAIAADFKKKYNQEIVVRPKLPEVWESLLQDYEAWSFTWQAQNLNGWGVMVFCPVCKTAALFRFFRPDPAHEEILGVLAEYKDHRTDGRTNFRIYDIGFLSPPGFSLTDYEFKPGAFELSFSKARLSLSIHRFGPASVILRNQTLADFGAGFFDIHAHGFQAQEDPDSALEYQQGPRTWLSRKLARLKKRPSYNMIRLWTAEEENRILAVRLMDHKPFDFKILIEASRDYELV